MLVRQSLPLFLFCWPPSVNPRYDTQHVTMNKGNHEYHEWKRKHDAEVQRAIKNHPIASVFLNLTKNI